ncbi:MAG: succinate dehydrogenase, hydrophobic membrane anchor protein [Rhodobacteraceae bacterium]|nr:succinate dehydrogenase, hydrophobic membrane anchor protein [Paracoccaceae bacterium]
MTYRTGYSRVAGLGSAREGVRHWWLQRLTSVALIPLSIPFVLIFGASLGQGRDIAIQAFGHPLAAVATILFLVAGFHHLQQGLQVVIEDYVLARRTATILHIINLMLCWAFAIVGIFAVARISFGLAG